MKLRVALVTKIDVIAVDDKDKTYTFKLADNPILVGISVGDSLFLDGDVLKVQPTASTEQLAQAVAKSQAAAPVSGRSSANKARSLDAYR